MPTAVAFVSIVIKSLLFVSRPSLATHGITLLEETVNPFEALVLEWVVTLPTVRLRITACANRFET